MTPEASRLAKAAGSLGGWLVLALGLAACTSEDPGSDSSVTSVATTGAHAEADPTSGTITMPIDRYSLSPAEQGDIVAARRVAMISCVAANGITSADSKRRVIPDNDTSRRYGLWLMPDAQRYGYLLSESSEKLDVVKRKPDPYTEAELDMRAKCADMSEVKALRLDGLEAGPWSSELTAVDDAAPKTSAWVEIVKLWKACVVKAGFTPEPDNLAVAGVDWEAVQKNEVREDDVKRAVVDVACKDETHLVQRLGDLDASAQAPVVKKYQADLDQSRAKLDEVHARAVAVLKEAGL